jgi:hypothetical protein
MPAAAHPVRFPLAFRVGVTGTRDLDVGSLPAVRTAVADVLGTIRQECAAIAAEPWANGVHAVEAGVVRSRLTLLSPLAEGADRLVAAEALQSGYDLSVALPFEQAEYERDFPDSVAEFRSLLDRAEGHVLALDGGRGKDEWRSYEAVGRLVVRNCDALIAIWDDKVPAKGRGGTEDTIRFALRVGLPVWWIDASGKRSPVLIEDDLADRRHRGGLSTDSDARLRRYIKTQLTPPAPPVNNTHGILHRLIGVYLWVARRSFDPLRIFLNEIDPGMRRMWKAHASFMKTLAWRIPQRGGEQSEAVDSYWTRVYEPPDRLAKAYAARYRSTYLYVFGLAALALSCAALALALETSQREQLITLVAAGELVALFLILVLVAWNFLGRWHERWIGYRLLAELCRKQEALATLGWALPALEVTRAASPGGAKPTWINWYFEAAVRAAPLATGSLAGKQLAEARDTIRATLLAGQIAYHRDRAAESERAASTLLLLGEACFLLTMICVALKLWVLLTTGASEGVVLLLGLAAAVLPALSAALFAIRAYAELEVLADQSERMHHLLIALQNRLKMIDLGVPLASQDLGRDLFHLATAMLADVAGWAQLFRMKAVEAG